MRIVYITFQFYPKAYGSGVHAYEVCLRLSKLGHKIYILCMGDLNSPAHETWKGLEIFRIRFPFSIPYYNQLNPLLFWLLGYRILRKIDAEVLIGHGFESSLFIKFSKIPIKIYKAVGTIKIQRKARPIISWIDKVGILGFYINSWLEMLAIKCSRRIIAISNSIKKEIGNSYNISTNKISVIYNGITLKRFKKRPEKKIGDVINILFVGRLSSIKGPQVILKLIPTFIKKYDGKLHFMFVGDGPLYNYINRFIEKSNYSKYVTLYGFVSNNLIPNYYAKSDLCIIPSYYEPFGLVALECIASEVSIIASKVGGLAEILEPIDKNLVFSINDLDELKNKITHFITNPIGNYDTKSAKNLIKNKYSWKENALKTIKLIQAIKNK